ncbi:Anti-sigma regulatory factor (Ser/Thr protein kinase) [Micromonospora viridifaciens]|uniref:Anti-sigma regulatory factor (Ser/Thr protein kinase) n=1 Tax=Micromonospora viridifaciens TaxID=1881 RepID=A0A1C4Y713_MICVI|nr:ATP-binding protein [Micromonospora viridifaciens]SCF16492.1 Anti-sigma regulatory factor (Ser/Thr protein kinase) [Micromonospora viridifaciens]
MTLLSESISEVAVTRLRHAVAASAGATGLAGDGLEDFVLAVHELVTNVVRHGGGSGRLRLMCDAASVSCQVIDHGPGTEDVPIALPRPGTPGHRGLWLAQQLSDSLVIDSGPYGTTATVTARLPGLQSSG